MKLQQPSFGGGEYAPELFGRQDLARYQISGRTVENFIIRPYGGMDRRTGTGWCGEVKDSTKVVNLIGFEVGDSISYVIELGDYYARFLYRGAYVLAATTVAYAAGTTYALGAYIVSAGITYRSLQAANLAHTPASSPTWWEANPLLELITPWSQSQVFAISHTQSADTLYMVHPSHKQRVIKRTEASMFTIAEYVVREGPFRSLNPNEALLMTASATTGTVTVTTNFDLFDALMIGGLIYIEPASLGNIKPWVQGERTPTLAVGVMRRSEGKIYKATNVATVVAPNYCETGNVRPTHDTGREWDGPADTRKFDTITYTVGVEWEYQHAGYGIIEITAVTDARTVTGVVKKTLPPEVVGGIGAASNTWTKSGTGVALTFTGLTGATSTDQSNYLVTIDGVPIPSDPNSGGAGNEGGGGPGSGIPPGGYIP